MNEWMAEAACADSPLNFTPEENDTRAQWAAAKVCARECPVRGECAEFAAKHRGQLFGVYAGHMHAWRKVTLVTRPAQGFRDRRKESAA